MSKNSKKQMYKRFLILIFTIATMGLFFISPYVFLSCKTYSAERIIIPDKESESVKPNKIITDKLDRDCRNAPPGMVCIPGGKAILGAEENDNEAQPGEKPQRTVYVKTFYMDKYEVTNEEYMKCVRSGACKHFKNYKHRLYRDSRGAKQPAVPISWNRAFDYCKWKGKRLPSEAEWEKVARNGMDGTKYPWGNEPPTKDRANFRPYNKTTSNVGSFPAGHYGVYDMAGNGYEWVNDWATYCIDGCDKPCGSDCKGDNPQGPCSGRYPCGKRYRKIMKGGSWWWPGTHMRGSWRRVQKMNSGGHRLSARCASNTPELTNAPAWSVKKSPERLTDPTPPSNKELETLHDIQTDTLNKTICADKWTSPAHCKDPVSYIKPNESQVWLFKPYIKNLGGGYAGVAADGNYTYISYARSRWVWLFDFDRNIVALHKILKSLILKSETPKMFVERFNPKREKSTMEIIRNAFENDKEYKIIKYVFYRYRFDLYPHYKKILRPKKKFKGFGWLRDKGNYRYIRLLHQQNRIAIIPGDMLKGKTMVSIGNAARKLGTKIRIYYPSNAEEFWVFNHNYKRNISNMPFDEASVVLRTVHEYPWHKRMKGIRFWHYVVHGALNYQRKLSLKDFYKIDHFRQYRVFPSKKTTFSTIEVSSTLPNYVKPALDE